MERCLVLAARAYSFNDKETGRLVEGTTVTYLSGDVEAAQERRGMEPLTIAGPADVMATIGPLPAVCDMDFRSRPGPKGRPQLVLANIAPVKSVELAKLLAQVGAGS